MHRLQAPSPLDDLLKTNPITPSPPLPPSSLTKHFSIDW